MLDRLDSIWGDRSFLAVCRDRLWQLYFTREGIALLILILILILILKNKIFLRVKKTHFLPASSIVTLGLLLIFLTSCSVPRVASEDRVFLNLSLDFLGEYQLPQSTFEEMPVGSISGIAYDRDSGSVSGKPGFRFYGVSGDSGKYAPPRFYTLRLALTPPESEEIGIAEVEIENVTFLKNKDGEFFPTGKLYPEGIVLSPRKTVFVASVGKSDLNVPPVVGEFALNTGKLFTSLPIPDRYLPQAAEGVARPGKFSDSDVANASRPEDKPLGVRDGGGFDALTIDPTTFSPDGLDPFRLFVGVESPLLQDDDGNGGGKLRVLHYAIADRASLLVSENFYPLDETLESSADSTLADLVALDKGGYFLSLERSGGLSGKGSFFGSIFEIFSGDATDTSRIVSLKEESPGIKPLKKKLLLDLAAVGLTGGNLSGMTLGPHLPDGSQSLVVVSNEEVDGAVLNRFLLFRLVES